MAERKIRTIKRLNKKGKLSRTAIRKAVETVLAARKARLADASANGAGAEVKRHWSEEEEALS